MKLTEMENESQWQNCCVHPQKKSLTMPKKTGFLPSKRRHTILLGLHLVIVFPLTFPPSGSAAAGSVESAFSLKTYASAVFGRGESIDRDPALLFLYDFEILT